MPVSENNGIAYNKLIDDYSSSSYIYICEALAGSATSNAVWKIFRITLATGLLQWADGDNNFDNVADDRTSLSYS
jgi:hypothetical protein